jgi:hypothetical protein
MAVGQHAELHLFGADEVALFEGDRPVEQLYVVAKRGEALLQRDPVVTRQCGVFLSASAS